MPIQNPIDAQSLIDNIDVVRYDPTRVKRVVLNQLDSIAKINPAHPFSLLLESACVIASAGALDALRSTRRPYAVLAQNMEELYHHMSDEDYVGRFAMPSKSKFIIGVQENELLNSMVLDTTTGYKKVVIPRNTFFTVNNTDFSLQYPIEIRQLLHGGIQIVYDVSVTSPLRILTTNTIKLMYRTDENLDKWIFFEVDVDQFSIETIETHVQSATDFSLDIDFPNKFYYARAYLEVNGRWIEINTTHSDLVYDAKKPTLVLKVTDNTLNVSMPQVYITTGLVNGPLRIDVYTTKGKLDMVLSEYTLAAYTATWQALDKNEVTKFTNPILNLRTILAYSLEPVSGGRDPLTFEQLRQNVIANALGPMKMPISDAQVEVALDDIGYQVIKKIDNVNSRVFHAAKLLPKPSAIAKPGTVLPKAISAASASIEMGFISMQGISTFPGVIDNNSIMTITPGAYYQIVNGRLRVLTSADLQRLKSLSLDKLASEITAGNYVFSPFHYVLDASNPTFFDTRPYYLDSPKTTSKSFLAINDTTLLNVATDLYNLEKTGTGYALTVTTVSDENFRELDDAKVFAQLSFTPYGEKDPAYLNGVLIKKDSDGERTFAFDLSTNFIVDSNDNLMLTKFKMYGNSVGQVGIPLEAPVDIIYAVSATMPTTWQRAKIDNDLAKTMLPIDIAAITKEQISLKFGDSLSSLWCRSKTLTGSVQYKKYDADIPATYSQDVYETYPDGTSVKIAPDGTPTMTLLHHKGDPVLNAEGGAVWLHRAGETFLDPATNAPVVLSQRDLIRQVEFFMLEGVYRFTTDDATLNYREELIAALVSWITNDLGDLRKRLLDQSRIYFYPKTTMGNIEVLTSANAIQTMDASQAFTVKLYVSKEVDSNTKVKANLEAATVDTIATELAKEEVCVSDITRALRAVYGSDVKDVSVTGLGGSANYDIVTVIDPTTRCGLRKRLTLSTDNSLVVEEDVTIQFITHEQ